MNSVLHLMFSWTMKAWPPLYPPLEAVLVPIFWNTCFDLSFITLFMVLILPCMVSVTATMSSDAILSFKQILLFVNPCVFIDFIVSSIELFRILPNRLAKLSSLVVFSDSISSSFFWSKYLFRIFWGLFLL